MLFELTQKICSAFGASGRESTVAKIIENEISSFVDEVYYDKIGNLIAHKKGTGKKVMTASHMDTVGFIVNYIEENGFLRFALVGELPIANIINTSIRFENGTFGVISYEDSKSLGSLKVSDFYIDIGAKSRDEALQKVEISDFAVICGTHYAQDGIICGPNLDSRIACVAQILAIKQALPTENDIYYVFTVQEEVGLRGATVASYHINPDFGIAIDVTVTADTPKTQHKLTVKLGDGACVKLMDRSVICNPVATDVIYKACEQLSIKPQHEILGFGATDASAIQRAKDGTLVGAISIPMRYINSPCEVVSQSDVLDAVKILAKSVTMF